MKRCRLGGWTLLVLYGWLGVGVGHENNPVYAKETKRKAATASKVTLRLNAESTLTLKATWSRFKHSRMHFDINPQFAPYYATRVAIPQRKYNAQALSLFLPKYPVQVGEAWTIPMHKVGHFFKQFHPNVVMLLHNGGPNGAYGMLRALSPRYAEVTFRIHVEFALKPGYIFYTPGLFTGRLVLDRKTQRAVYLRMYLPNHRIRNVDLNAHGQIDAVYAKTMQLEGGNAKIHPTIKWKQSVTWKHANLKLAQQFYEFMKIQWRSVPEALKAARKQKKPIHLFVVFGSLDDQSC